MRRANPAAFDDDAVDVAPLQAGFVEQLGLVGPIQIQHDGTFAVAELPLPCWRQRRLIDRNPLGDVDL